MEQNSDKADAPFTRIEPASISLTTQSATAEPATKPLVALRNSPLIWLGLGVLFTSALVVVFLLPRWVATSGTSAVPAVTNTSTTAGSVQKPVTGDKVSPWEKAQESQLRKETQDILSQMLEAQKALAERGVELWAAEDYALAMQHAASGDDYYNKRAFPESRNEYEQALTIFSALVKKMDKVFKATMETGQQALIEGNSQAAMQAFQLALAIDAIDRTALKGQQRATTLDEVLALMDKAGALLNAGKLDEAKQTYQQVLELDGDYKPAAEQIALSDEMILDRKFNIQMSAGFAAMEKQRFSEARQAFNSALKLKPRAIEARSALEQSDHQLTTLNINNLLASARELEAEEDWHGALKKYQAALKLDSSLAEAQRGEQLTSLRSQLHDRLQLILSQPTRLYDNDVYNETLEFRNKLQALSDPGPLLRKQLASLATLLTKAATPVNINLLSDNRTRVTLRKVAELGQFVEKSLSLRPGKYVLVGIREGYRDVRIEFSVDPDKAMPPLIVQAEEKIALGR